MKTEKVRLSRLQKNESNPRTITNQKLQKLINSILVLPKMMEIRPIVVNDSFTAIGGNMRLEALIIIQGMSEEQIKERLQQEKDFQKKTEAEQEILVEYWEKWKSSPTVHIINANELSDEEQQQFIVKDNVGYVEWDMAALNNMFDKETLDDWGLETWTEEGAWQPIGLPKNSKPSVSLAERFVAPPFSILDTRQGYWQKRKKAWREIIGDLGESRQCTFIKSPEMRYKTLYEKSIEERKKLGISFTEYLEKYVPKEVKESYKGVCSAGVSILDPVMAETMCRWFGFENAKTFDPFAGDSVFGYVSAKLGNEFTGIEIREEQAMLNNERVEGMKAKYINDDGQNVAKHIMYESQDLLFSCPPYFDLEVYSDLENDASNQDSYEDFIKILENAFKDSTKCLKNNRFAVICVGDVRNKTNGCYYDFCGDIKRIFKEAGMNLYNEIILIENSVTSPLRASNYMKTRKVVKMHQNILVFYKGDANEIKNNYNVIEYASEDLESFGLDSRDQPTED